MGTQRQGFPITALESTKMARIQGDWLGRKMHVLLGSLFFGCFSASVVALGTLPYSTSWIDRVNDAEVLAPPKDTFKAGLLTWDLNLYRQAPELRTFRDTFASCSELTGLDAARCVADLIKVKSPRGDPHVEFVDDRFDPAVALRTHMEGAPGHCTSRSAMSATSLLALGVPARIVQVLPLVGKGHNLLEVWDAKHGWLIFDPLFDSSYLLGDSFLSAVQLSQVAGGLRWRRPSEGQVDPNLFAGSTISYPEPWLYTRVGERCAQWPFRGCFAQVGPAQFRYGPAQRFAMGGIVVFGLGLAAWVCAWLWSARSRSVVDDKEQRALIDYDSN